MTIDPATDIAANAQKLMAKVNSVMAGFGKRAASKSAHFDIAAKTLQAAKDPKGKAAKKMGKGKRKRAGAAQRLATAVDFAFAPFGVANARVPSSGFAVPGYVKSPAFRHKIEAAKKDKKGKDGQGKRKSRPFVPGATQG